MNIYNYLQVNSNFIYSKKLNLSFVENFHKLKLKVKKYNNESFCELLESAVFSKETTYIHIISKQGEFILTNVTNEIPHEKIQEYLKNNSANSPTYYFSNVDYFSYGRFGIAENGKIVRYLSYNSEAADDEPIVKWIGKPHTWEVETHTFYTKKKLEECEMDFGYDEVCQMAEFYLPFINNELDITNCTIYSKNIDLLNSLSKIKTTKNTLLDKKQIKTLYDFLQLKNTSSFCFILRINKNKIVIDSQILYNYTPNETLENTKALTNPKTYELFYRFINNPQSAFKSNLLKAIKELKQAEIKEFLEIAKNKKTYPNHTNYYLVFEFLSYKKLNIYLLRYDENDNVSNKILVSNKITNKAINFIYSKTFEWFNKDNKKE